MITVFGPQDVGSLAELRFLDETDREVAMEIIRQADCHLAIYQSGLHDYGVNITLSPGLAARLTNKQIKKCVVAAYMKKRWKYVAFLIRSEEDSCHQRIEFSTEERVST